MRSGGGVCETPSEVNSPFRTFVSKEPTSRRPPKSGSSPTITPFWRAHSRISLRKPPLVGGRLGKLGTQLRKTWQFSNQQTHQPDIGGMQDVLDRLLCPERERPF